MNLNYDMYRKLKLVYESLQKSKFRSSFKLGFNEFKYIETKGLKVINRHCKDFLYCRISKISSSKFKDGKQTPYKGHPVFIAQHATGVCCRKCLKKWHGIPIDRELFDEEIIYLCSLIMYWIKKQIKFNQGKK